MGMNPVPAVLATDLDGTLAVDGSIGVENRRAAAALREAGIPILVITGRNRWSVDRVRGLWDVADAVLFSSGAGLLEGPGDAGRELCRLPEAQVRAIRSVLDAAGEDYVILDPAPENHHGVARRHRPATENPDFERRWMRYRRWIRADDGSDRAASQFIVIRPPGAPGRDGLESVLSSWSTFGGSSPLDGASLWLEVFPAGRDKGRALADWCRSRGIADDRVMVLGNDLNDVPMLRRAAHPRVVADSPRALRERFPVVAPADRDGFAAAAREALRLFGRGDSVA